jgi:GNAT superfamily N-acetyltransferase
MRQRTGQGGPPATRKDPDGEELLRRWGRSLPAGYAALTAAAGSGEGRRLAGGAVQAFRVPAMAQVSVSNGVVCRDVDALDGVLGELEDWYAGLAWAVWLAPWQVEHGVPLLQRHGFELDEPTTLMAGWLDELDLRPQRTLGLAPEGSWGELVEVVDAGFGMPDGLSFAPAFAGTAPQQLRAWVARVEGGAAACAASVTEGQDVWFALVATRPEHRGRGLSSELMRTALRAARAEGCTSTSLESSAQARSVYGRLGYRDLGEAQLWERAPG